MKTKKRPRLGDVLLAHSWLFYPDADRVGRTFAHAEAWHAAIVCDVRGLAHDGSFRLVAFRYGGEGECFDVYLHAEGKTWKEKPA